ncbi:type II toxin-antitoxin system CcdA family antitoxin [Sandaracinobacteroides saxicola]|uniref:Type II toxin-antitoxin system CcdA family antitoxin n=1 Tax=Sandaracinobacteroides saxicola TaxID=2759707 RepID=A0A7G5IJG4_9SPHN|nr:type II toxin-antitoxin system CcdA family antitoxin [Sandaracinobacteroides saxicola]QMW23506.1 type II toxin-antitoxin system CcdA family antitoxin [Sandaracinobacteroides saxicola]
MANLGETRRAVNITLTSSLVDEAKSIGLNLSRVCEAALASAVKAEQAAAWKRENQAAIEATNAWVEKHGLPLEKYRLF